MDLNLTKEQEVFVQRYQALYNQLSDIEHQIQELGVRAKSILEEIESMRVEEDKLFEKEQ
jgi:hypothetical protein